MSEQVLLVERHAAVAVVTLNRPKSKNALNAALIDGLHKALTQAAEDSSVRTIVLTGSGGSFCAGADLKSAMSDPEAFADLDRTMTRYHSLIRAIVNAPKPVIAMVEGPAVGFGCDMAFACDMRMLSPDAYFEERFVKIGLMPDGGGSFWLPRLVGLTKAMELMFTGDRISAEQALSLGIVNRVVAAEALREETMKLADKLAKSAPLALAAIKRSTLASLGGSLDDALDRERKEQIKLLQTNDCMEGVAAWMQKRDPSFEGK